MYKMGWWLGSSIPRTTKKETQDPEEAARSSLLSPEWEMQLRLAPASPFEWRNQVLSTRDSEALLLSEAPACKQGSYVWDLRRAL